MCSRVKKRGEIFREVREVLRREQFAHRKRGMFRDFAKFARLSSRKQLAKFANFAFREIGELVWYTHQFAKLVRSTRSNAVNYRNEQLNETTRA